MTSGEHISVNSAAVTGRLAVNPPQEPDSSLWFSDREIGGPRTKAAHLYTTEDYRRELKRVERRYYRIAFLCIALAIIAAVIIVLMVLRIV